MPIANAALGAVTGGGVGSIGRNLVSAGKQMAIDKAKEFGMKKLDKATKGRFGNFMGKYGDVVNAGVSFAQHKWNNRATTPRASAPRASPRASQPMTRLAPRDSTPSASRTVRSSTSRPTRSVSAPRASSFGRQSSSRATNPSSFGRSPRTSTPRASSSRTTYRPQTRTASRPQTSSRPRPSQPSVRRSQPSTRTTTSRPYNQRRYNQQRIYNQPRTPARSSQQPRRQSQPRRTSQQPRRQPQRNSSQQGRQPRRTPQQPRRQPQQPRRTPQQPRRQPQQPQQPRQPRQPQQPRQPNQQQPRQPTTRPVEQPSRTTSGSRSIDADTLRRAMPTLNRAKAEEYAPYIAQAMREAGINTPQRQAAFLAQLAHESGSLRYMEEIASGRAYEGRRDLGNTQAGDGVRFKGRGPIQLTGRANYAAAGRDLGIDLVNNPTMAARPDVGFRVAAWYWNKRGLNNFADQGTQAGFDQITRRINGGYNGKADRDQYWRRFQNVLGEN